jgi:hypothetical protein
VAEAVEHARRIRGMLDRYEATGVRPRSLSELTAAHAKDLKSRIAALTHDSAVEMARRAGIESLASWVASGDLPMEALAGLKGGSMRELAEIVGTDAQHIRLLQDALRRRVEARDKDLKAITRLSIYNDLLRAGLTTEPAILDAGPEAVSLVTGATGTQAASITYAAMRGLAKSVYAVHLGGKFKLDMLDEPAGCCPPFSPEDWRDRYDFYSQRSALTALLERVKAQVVAQIRAVGAALDAHKVLFERYGIWADPAGSADIDALKAARSKAEALAATAAMRTKLDDLAGRMKIDHAFSSIRTGIPPDYPGIGTGAATRMR